MKNISFLIFFSLFLASPAFGEGPHKKLGNSSVKGESVRLLGQFIRLSKSDARNVLGHDYYFYLSDDKGKEFAFPVELHGPGLANEINSHGGQTFYIDAVPRQQRLVLKELQQNVTVLHLFKVSPIDLASVGVSGGGVTPNLNGPSHDKNPKARRGQVKDSWADTIIFSGAAALLGTILVK